MKSFLKYAIIGALLATLKFTSTFLEQITTDITKSYENPNRIHLVFVGDSVTRYQYLNLVGWVQRRKYDTDFLEHWNETYDMHVTHSDWNGLFRNESRYLNETMCECFRTKCCFQNGTMENRYFQFGNTHLTYFQWFGFTAYPHGIWKPQEGEKKPICNGYDNLFRKLRRLKLKILCIHS